MMSDDDKLEFTEKLLDKIDLSGYLKEYKGKSLSDLMDILGDDYDFTDFTKNEVCEGVLFNWMNEAEFEDYLHERYHKNFYTTEVITKYVSWNE